MQEKDVIQQSSSPWASPIVLVKKKDGTTRFCVDYRKLNNVTRKDAYPLPRIDLTLDTLSGSRWFSTLQYLGHLISPSGVCPDPTKTEKVATWPKPTSTRSIQQFLGFANYYQWFIKDFTQIAKPLHQLTERGIAFSWSKDCEDSFNVLRDCLSGAPLLVFPDFNKPFILDTDASDIGIVAVLAQADEEGRLVQVGAKSVNIEIIACRRQKMATTDTADKQRLIKKSLL